MSPERPVGPVPSEGVGEGVGAAHAIELRDVVPHRPPILGLDRVLEVGPEHAHAERDVVPGPDVDDDGILWQQALVEGIAQTAAALHGRAAALRGERVARGMLVGLRRLSFHRDARVGDRVEYRVELLKELDALSLVRGEARVGDVLLAEGQLKFYVEGGA